MALHGLSAFRVPLIQVNTPDSAFTWRESGIPVMVRAEIVKRYPGHRIVEVVPREPGVWREFRVLRLEDVGRS